jgi:glycine C-acetyltransferase
MSGQSTLNEKFEQMAADLSERKLRILNYGYRGCFIIDSLAGRHDVIVYDSESHACIMDGLRDGLSKRLSLHTMTWSASKRQLQND